MADQNTTVKSKGGFKYSTALKMFTIGFLFLVLLTPTTMIKSLIRERSNRNAEVVKEISSKWGGHQAICGPVLSIPYKEYSEGTKNYSIEYIHILPEELRIDSFLDSEVRYRGIYEAVLYNADVQLSGVFIMPKLKDLGIKEKDVIFQNACISLGIEDMKGIRREISAIVNDVPFSMNPGIETKGIIASGVSSKVQLQNKVTEVRFDFKINLNGSKQINFVPLGKTTEVSLSCDWPHPSFNGVFLPEERSINDKGFDAKWKILHLNRDFPQLWIGDKYKYEMGKFLFGVELFKPVDVYQKSMRAVKYASLFVLLTFLAFFFSEIFKKKPLHPIQYTLIGCAIIIFYLLIIALSEHMNFEKAYLISGAAVVLLITVYAAAILRSVLVSISMGCILSVFYSYLYMLLQMEDYAILMGSIGLFVILSGIMLITRKIDWYSISS